MQIPVLKAEPRTNSGTKAMRKLRANGGLPGVLYGRGGENVNLQFSLRDIQKLVHEADHVVELAMGDVKQTALVRGLQRDFMGDHLQHIDFIRIDLHEKVRLKLPLKFVGTPRGAAHGGLLEVMRGEVEVHCPATSIPKYVEIEVTHLEVDQAVRFKDLKLPKDADLIPNPEGLVVKCAHARRATEEAPGATAAAPGAAPAAAAAAPAAKAAAKPAGKK